MPDLEAVQHGLVMELAGETFCEWDWGRVGRGRRRWVDVDSPKPTNDASSMLDRHIYLSSKRSLSVKVDIQV